MQDSFFSLGVLFHGKTSFKKFPQKCFHQIKIPFRLNDEAHMTARNRADLRIQFPEQLCKTVLMHFCKKHRQFSNRCQPARCAECFFSYTAAAMHQRRNFFVSSFFITLLSFPHTVPFSFDGFGYLIRSYILP